MSPGNFMVNQSIFKTTKKEKYSILWQTNQRVLLKISEIRQIQKETGGKGIAREPPDASWIMPGMQVISRKLIAEKRLTIEWVFKSALIFSRHLHKNPNFVSF
jgi:hypothetical protein